MEDELNTVQVLKLEKALNTVKYLMKYVEVLLLLKTAWKDKRERGQSLLLDVGDQISRAGRR